MATTAIASTTGILNIKGEHDWFKVNLDANTLYAFTLTGLPSTIYTGITLYGASGLLDSISMAYGSVAAAFMTVNAGTYYVDVGDYYSSTTLGSYTLNLATSPDDYRNNISTNGNIVVGGPSVGGVINVAGDQDWLRVVLTENTLYAITTTGLSTPGSSSISLVVIDDKGVAVEAGDAHGTGAAAFMPRTSGTYYVEASSFTAGNYTISVATSPDDYWNNTSKPGSVNVGASAPGTINIAGDHDWFRVNLSANKLYGISTNNDTSELSIYDASGVAVNDPFAFASGGGGAFMTATGGTYYIDVSDTKTGAYSLSVGESPDEYTNNTTTDGKVAPGASVSGNINLVGDQDWIKVSLNANTLYAISITGLDVSAGPYSYSTAFLQMLDRNGAWVPAVDATGVSGNMGFMPISSDEYYINASSFYLTGPYTLSVAVTPDDYNSNQFTDGKISVGGNKSGIINVAGDHDWFEVSLAADTLYAITTGVDSAYTLTIHDDRGYPVPALDAMGGTLGFMPTTSGTYYVDVGSMGVTEVGAYTLHVAVSADDYTNNTRTLGRLGSAPVNHTPSGTVTIAGTPTQGQTLTASSDLTDIDGLGPIIYIWKAGGEAITGTTASTLILTEAHVGKTISVTASYTDLLGTPESATSAGTQAVLGYQVGSSGDNTLIGTAYADNLLGMGGNDSLTGGGGNDTIDGGAGVDTLILNGNLSGYSLTKIGNSYTVGSNTGVDGTDTVTNVEALKFADKTVNLTIQAKAAAAPQADVQNLAELYVAFFNRVPDADGLSYWIDQKAGGLSLNQIADSFYAAGIVYSEQTGFTTDMTDADFVRLVYKNVLGRSGATAPPDGDVNYWAGDIHSGNATRGSLISTMLYSAHTFKGDGEWGWVADLLDNKIAVSKTFAIEWGLNFNTPQDSITQGMAIAAAITPTGTQEAIALIGVSGADMHLV
jgi:hypothetical protein